MGAAGTAQEVGPGAAKAASPSDCRRGHITSLFPLEAQIRLGRFLVTKITAHSRLEATEEKGHVFDRSCMRWQFQLPLDALYLTPPPPSTLSLQSRVSLSARAVSRIRAASVHSRGGAQLQRRCNNAAPRKKRQMDQMIDSAAHIPRVAQPCSRYRVVFACPIPQPPPPRPRKQCARRKRGYRCLVLPLRCDDHLTPTMPNTTPC